MAINPAASYPGQTAAPNGNYPYGSAVNVSAPGAGDGTPWEKGVVNDIWGLLQAILSAAAITPSGDPDTAVASQYYNGLNALFNQSAAGSTVAAGLLQLSDDITSTSTARAATINAVNQLRTLLLPVIVGNQTGWSIKFGKAKIQGGQFVANNDATTNVILGTVANTSAYTGAHLAFVGSINENNNNDRSPLKFGIVNSSTGFVRNTDNDNLPAGWISFGYDA